MAVRLGKDIRLYIAGYDLSALASSIQPKSEMELAKYAVNDGVAGYHFLPGLSNDSLDVEGIFDDVVGAILNTLHDTPTPASAYVMNLIYGSTIGDPAHCAADSRMENYKAHSVVTDMNRVAFSMKAHGVGLSNGQLLYPKTAITADTNGSILDGLAASAAGIDAYAHVFAIGGAGAKTATVKIYMDDNSGFLSPTLLSDMGGATAIGTLTGSTSGAVERYLRASITFAGGAPYAATVAIIIKRK